MTTKATGTTTTALIVTRRQPLQVALPLLPTQARPRLDEANRGEAVAALARLLLEAVGAARDTEADDEA
jgi:hypothetical protein